MNTITPIEIVDRPTDPYRIICILEELRKVWGLEPGKTLGQILADVLRNEYRDDKISFISGITDDELVAAIQNYEN